MDSRSCSHSIASGPISPIASIANHFASPRYVSSRMNSFNSGRTAMLRFPSFDNEFAASRRTNGLFDLMRAAKSCITGTAASPTSPSPTVALVALKDQRECVIFNNCLTCSSLPGSLFASLTIARTSREIRRRAHKLSVEINNRNIPVGMRTSMSSTIRRYLFMDMPNALRDSRQ